FLHVVTFVAMILLAWPVALNFFRIDNKVLQALILLGYLGSLLFLLFMPLGFYSPCIMEKGTLGPKPALIGHRGAPMLAPENTEMSFKKAVHHGAVGFETDVTISFDGVPFLMHDKTLKRTTNIASVFPGFKDINAALFPWEYLEKLNAGNWFFEEKPFFQRPAISPEEEELGRNQSIFKLSDFLKLAKQENKLILFDLNRLPWSHPYNTTWINRTLEVLQSELGNKSHLVLWLENLKREEVINVAPGFQQTSGKAVSIEELRKHNIVKSPWPNWLPLKYLKSNITVNLWVVNEPWLFSLAWCSGVQSVTTDSVHTLGKLHQPSFLMTPKEYMTMWIVTDVVAVFFISLIFGFHR
uniref:Glycerophosphodiester phosphodiesterase domain containing 4 n=1 Tax=Salvator merianae TaxID=96440 RepID=A0A8D0DMQ4_SALMN